MRIIALAAASLGLAACSSEPPAPAEPPPAPEAGLASDATKAANAAVAERLPLGDQSDFNDAGRGFLAAIEEDAILDADGNVVWNIRSYDFLDGDAPDTVNPSLWRQSQLAAQHGLFEVTDGIWQVRGYDLAVMSVIEGETGWIIVDPLTAAETAAAALKLVNDTLGERPVSAVLYTHSHADHFGGARGVVSEEDIAERGVEVLAPIGFTEAAVGENLLAGNHMSRRATLMFGAALPRSATGHVGSGLGPGLPQGTIGLVLPTEEISGRGTVREVDGVTFEFIDAAGTEAPAEFMFYLPERRALCTAEVATATFHNVLTPRGAVVRDALGWSQVIDWTLANYGDKSDVVFASHHWPTWGTENVQSLLATQRDIYRYVHDQTLRKANAGATMAEAAETLAEPEDLQGTDFASRGYYGTLNHNSKAVYQHYFGWWGGVPADYHALPPEEEAAKYVEAMGGLAATIQRGADAYEAGEYRWAARVLNHAVFAGPENAEARGWLAAAYEQMGFQAESGAWRSYYLAAAQELRVGTPEAEQINTANPDFLRAVPTEKLFDALASRYNPEKMTAPPYAVNFEFTDEDRRIAVLIGKSVVTPRPGFYAEGAAADVRMTRSALDRLITQQASFQELMAEGALQIEGGLPAVAGFLLSLDTPTFWFPVVTP
ncbi:MAG: alkyl sulfatase dimerization domain-containing protein [Pseudomonadota bacterium]